MKSKGKGKAKAKAISTAEDPSTADPPVTPARSFMTPHPRLRMSSSKVRDSNNVASALEILYPDSPIQKTPRRRKPPSSNRNRHITFESPPLPAPSWHQGLPSTAPPSPAQSSTTIPTPSSHPSSTPSSPLVSSSSSPSPSSHSGAPSPPPQPRHDEASGPAGNKTRHSADDVWTFYEMDSDRRICKFCRLVLKFHFVFHLNIVDRTQNESDSKHTITTFSANTTTGTLCRHLTDLHLQLWVQGCEKLGIEIKAKSARQVIDQNYKADPSSNNRIPYTNEAFVDALVAFIVGDDQVSPYTN
jgi:hypothetical protein